MRRADLKVNRLRLSFDGGGYAAGRAERIARAALQRVWTSLGKTDPLRPAALEHISVPPLEVDSSRSTDAAIATALATNIVGALQRARRS